jgi:O-antigen/teichoic acid export membrane protein
MATLGAWLVNSVFNVPESAKAESIVVMRLLAASLPFVILTAGLRGVLEAYQRFPVLNIIRIVLGVTNFLLPLVVLRFTNNLGPMVAALLITRIITTYAHWHFCAEELSLDLRHWAGSSHIRELLRFGGWMTVSNFVGPLLVYLDRFLLGAFLSMSAVAFYSTPYELITKLWLIPAAIVAVLFPAFSTTLASDRPRSLRLYERGLRYIFLGLFPFVLVAIAFSRFGLQIWLGHDFALQSTSVLQWLATAVFVNSLAQIPFIYIQAAGRPDLTAKFHLVEFPCYIVTLILLVRWHGITGAAIAWFARILLDSALLFYTAQRLEARLTLTNTLAFASAMLMFVFAVLSSSTIWIACTFTVVILISFIAVAWRWGLKEDERFSILKAVGFKAAW